MKHFRQFLCFFTPKYDTNCLGLHESPIFDEEDVERLAVKPHGHFWMDSLCFQVRGEWWNFGWNVPLQNLHYLAKMGFVQSNSHTRKWKVWALVNFLSFFFFYIPPRKSKRCFAFSSHLDGEKFREICCPFLTAGPTLEEKQNVIL